MNLIEKFIKARDKPKNTLPRSTYSFISAVPPAVRMTMSEQPCKPQLFMPAFGSYQKPLPVCRYTPRYSDRSCEEMVLEHPRYYLLHNEPNPEMTSFVFHETLMSHLLLWGNAPLALSEKL